MESPQLEERLVSICRQLVTRRWQVREADPCGMGPAVECCNPQQMNLLHLAAALGLLRVICTLLNWRLENSSPPLDQEVNPLACDSLGYTPLMWACANGHRDVVALLAQWDSSALNVTDRTGKSVAVVARQRGHAALAEELESRKILSARGRTTGDYHSSVTLAVSAENTASSTTTRQMLLAKRSSVDNVSSQANDNGGWRRPNLVKGHKLSRYGLEHFCWWPQTLKLI